MTLSVCHMLAAGVPLGHTFGRVGNFINGELYGRITKVPWGMVFPHAEGFSAKERWVNDFASSIGMPVAGGSEPWCGWTTRSCNSARSISRRVRS